MKKRPVSPRSHSPAHPLTGSPSSLSLGRNASERLQKLHQLVAAQKFPNTIQLAAQFEVDQKTIRRDIEWMKTHADAPIAYDRKRHGYCYSEPFDNFLGIPTVTEAEMFSLMVASKAIEKYQATPFHKPLQMAFSKLAAQLDRKIRFSLQDFDSVLSFRPFAPEVQDTQRYEAVARALQHGRALRFDYRKPGGKRPEPRRFHPYHLTCIENLWYVIGYDEDRSDFRTFVLGRITGPVTVGEKFKKRPNFDLNKDLRNSFMIMKGEGDYEIVIEFDAWAADMVRERMWYASQQITTLPGGGSRLRLRLSALEEIERWVLSWGTHANVIAPKVLADRIAQIAIQLTKRYSLAAP